MKYHLENSGLLVELNRVEIMDISVGDVIVVKGLPDTTYMWTDQDEQFMESNPDARLFLKVEVREDGTYHCTGMTVISNEVF